MTNLKPVCLLAFVLLINYATSAQNTFPSTGYAGIGTLSPQAQLHIVQNDNQVSLILQSSSAGWGSGMSFQNTAPAGKAWGIYSNAYGALCVTDIAAQVDRIHIGPNGNVGINTYNINDANNRLFVEGGIRARKVTVDQAQWPDYVFRKDYSLLPLDSVASYIQANDHLPGIPSADSVAKNGIELGSNQAALLKKVEELTLYVIELNRTVQAQARTLQAQAQKLATLEHATTTGNRGQ
jgi:hypothetical protein